MKQALWRRAVVLGIASSRDCCYSNCAGTEPTTHSGGHRLGTKAGGSQRPPKNWPRAALQSRLIAELIRSLPININISEDTVLRPAFDTTSVGSVGTVGSVSRVGLLNIEGKKMDYKSLACLALFTALLGMTATSAARNAPWGAGNVQTPSYKPHKVVYDVAVSDREQFGRVLDRASFLSTLYKANPFDASIVLVLHGEETRFFAVRDYAKNKKLMQRAQSLTVAGVIKIRMCQAAAKARGLGPKDVHGFVELVPMSDAEIVRLQQEGYAYMR